MLQGLHHQPLHAANTVVSLMISIKIDVRQIFSYVLERHMMLQGLQGEPLHAAHTIVGLSINIKIDFRKIFRYVQVGFATLCFRDFRVSPCMLPTPLLA